jgi:L-asparaginase
MKLLLIQTGGTIDKDYPKKQGAYGFEISMPAAERILKKIKPALEYEIVSLFKKDSQDILEKDRVVLSTFIKESSFDRILITHGTDSLLDTAAYLSSISSKCIVITGSLTPERCKDSDADFNLGVAIAATELMPPGVYVAMHARIYPWNEVERDPESGRFIKKRT